jgi:hypothetical protein
MNETTKVDSIANQTENDNNTIQSIKNSKILIGNSKDTFDLPKSNTASYKYTI